jgi:hypothetical protein
VRGTPIKGLCQSITPTSDWCRASAVGRMESRARRGIRVCIGDEDEALKLFGTDRLLPPLPHEEADGKNLSFKSQAMNCFNVFVTITSKIIAYLMSILLSN